VPRGTLSPLDTLANRDAARPYWKPRGAASLWTPAILQHCIYEPKFSVSISPPQNKKADAISFFEWMKTTSAFSGRNIGFIFQNYNLVPILNVYENIVLPVELDGDTVDKKFLREIIKMLDLESKLKNMPNNLSGGQQQRVAIARALITKPAIVLADEPTGNLDSKTSADVLGLLKCTSNDFNQTVVMITHNNEIAQLADRIVRIEDGKIVGCGIL
jgi:ABC-type lipoprotein export system ATPase subunit